MCDTTFLVSNILGNVSHSNSLHQTRRGEQGHTSHVCPFPPSLQPVGHPIGHQLYTARARALTPLSCNSITVTNSSIKSEFHTPPELTSRASVPDKHGSQLRHTSHQAQRVRTCRSHHEHHKQLRTTTTCHHVTLSLSELKHKFQNPPLHHHITSVDPGGIENMKLGHGRGHANTPTFFLKKKTHTHTHTHTHTDC